MRSTRNTVGGVFAAITAGISLVMAIWDVARGLCQCLVRRKQAL